MTVELAEKGEGQGAFVWPEEPEDYSPYVIFLPLPIPLSPSPLPISPPHLPSPSPQHPSLTPPPQLGPIRHHRTLPRPELGAEGRHDCQRQETEEENRGAEGHEG